LIYKAFWLIWIKYPCNVNGTVAVSRDRDIILGEQN